MSDDGHGPEGGGGRGRGGGRVPRRGLPRHRVLARRRGEARGYTVPQEVTSVDGLMTPALLLLLLFQGF